jgi:hypothetical protein
MTTQNENDGSIESDSVPALAALYTAEQKLLDKIPSIKYPTRLWLGHASGRLVVEVPILLREKRYAMAAAAIIAYGGIRDNSAGSYYF